MENKWKRDESLKIGLLKHWKWESLKRRHKKCIMQFCLFVFTYVGEYLKGPNSASVSVSGFHEADVNSDIQLIWMDHSHYVFGIQYKTQIRFPSTVLFSAPCSVWSKVWTETSVINNQSWLWNIQ